MTGAIFICKVDLKYLRDILKSSKSDDRPIGHLFGIRETHLLGRNLLAVVNNFDSLSHFWRLKDVDLIHGEDQKLELFFIAAGETLTKEYACWKLSFKNYVACVLMLCDLQGLTFLAGDGPDAVQMLKVSTQTNTYIQFVTFNKAYTCKMRCQAKWLVLVSLFDHKAALLFRFSLLLIKKVIGALPPDIQYFVIGKFSMEQTFFRFVM